MASREEYPEGRAPDCLVWEIVKDNHAHLHHAVHRRFSKERFNITGMNTPKFSGLLQKNAVDLGLSPSGAKIFIHYAHAARSVRPGSSTRVMKLSKSMSHADRLRDFVDPSRYEIMPALVAKLEKLTHTRHDERSD
ncbi:60S ribosomal protein L28 [Babesia ovata]|uniref:60S ribosomal protein L28 n=1 Tax=Babesia ovata TaxID=189622 RepID=A0A2H6K918_9APIC|nr:60S ribosomal protein L28 [Babesia ovata]GBE59496.1 60S ribosomal protein L28 [Babesia ovata]